ncbi:MAG: DUF167 domain-containing protein [Nitrospirae bacterium]|nr:MAG: DUF167 domain-containing protein [Nitrospirota bacterium]
MRKQLIKIKVIAGAKKKQIIESDGILKVYVNAPAVDEKANKAVIEILSEHFNVRKRAVKIIRGEKTREKVVEVISLPARYAPQCQQQQGRLP